MRYEEYLEVIFMRLSDYMYTEPTHMSTLYDMYLWKGSHDSCVNDPLTIIKLSYIKNVMF